MSERVYLDDIRGRVVYSPLPGATLAEAVSQAWDIKKALRGCTVVLYYNGKRVEVPRGVPEKEVVALYKRAGIDDL